MLGRDGEVDSGGNERENAVLGRNGGVEARARVHVQIASEHAGSRHDVAGGERHRGRAPWSDVDDLGVDAPFESLGSRDTITARRQRRRDLAAQRVDDRSSAGGAVVGTEARVDRAVDAADEEARGQRLAGVGVRDGHVELAAGRHVEHEVSRGPRHERGDAARPPRVDGGVPLHHRRRHVECESAAFARECPDLRVALRVAPDHERTLARTGDAAAHGGRGDAGEIGEIAPHDHAGVSHEEMQLGEAIAVGRARGARGRYARRLAGHEALLGDRLDEDRPHRRRDRDRMRLDVDEQRAAGDRRPIGDRTDP